jgi:hypothetical protein
MSDDETSVAPAADRGGVATGLRRVDERQEDALADDVYALWGEIEPTHQRFMERFLSGLPPDRRVLDAACGTGKYFPMVLASDRRLPGVDHAGAYLANAPAKFPQVPNGDSQPSTPARHAGGKPATDLSRSHRQAVRGRPLRVGR